MSKVRIGEIIGLEHMCADGFVSGPSSELAGAGANTDDELWQRVNRAIATAGNLA